MKYRAIISPSLLALYGLALGAPSVASAQTTPTPEPQVPVASPAAPTAPDPEAAAPAPAQTEPSPEEPSPAAPTAGAASPSEAKAAVVPAPASEPKAPEQAPAKEEPSLLPLKVTTSTWTRFEGRANYDVLGVSLPTRPRFLEGDAFFYRARLGFQTNHLQLTDGIQGFVQISPQASGKYGLNNTVTENNLGIYEGYFQLEGEGASFQAGRFMMNYGDSLIIGNLDWSHTGRAFDGMRSRIKLGKAFVDAFVTLARVDNQPAEGHPTYSDPLLAGDDYFWGIYAGLGPMLAEGLDLDAYLLGNSNVETDGIPGVMDPTVTETRGGATEVTLGLRAKQKLGSLDYRIEAGLQAGSRPVQNAAGGAAPNALGFQADAEVGYSVTPKIRFALNGIVASGDDPTTPENEAYRDLFPTGHKFLGLMDVIGARTNVGSGVLKAQAGLTESLKLMVDAHIFARLQGPALGQVDPDTKLAGYEVDAQLLQKIGGPGYVRGLYGIFIPNEGHYVQNETAHYVELEGGINF